MAGSSSPARAVVPAEPVTAGASLPVRRWHAELAWLPGAGVRADVLIEAAGDRFTAITPGIPAGGLPAGVTRLPGLTLPGLANGHSHAFHRALRGRVQAGAGTFWTWREIMYQVAGRLDPDSYLALATAAYAEMALAGITCVGEFHYLHHAPGGARYADPNELGRMLLTAAARAGLRITLLDTCYLSGGLDADGRPQPLAGPQLRFGDGDADSWAARVIALGAGDGGGLGPAARAGAAIHSVRAVPPGQMAPVLAWAGRLGVPLHAHLSEQVAENQACLAAYGRTPAQVLADAGALGPRATMVHATHLTSGDVELIGGSRTHSCFCPTTEADLADGIGPAVALAGAGSPLTVGSDSQAVIDLFTEVQRLELDQRLATGQRGHFGAARLAQVATAAGHISLGWPDAGALAPGALADLVTVSLDSVRLAGALGLAATDRGTGLPTAGSATPGPATPGPATPGSATAGSATAGSATPGSATPGSATPGPAAAGSATPGPETGSTGTARFGTASTGTGRAGRGRAGTASGSARFGPASAGSTPGTVGPTGTWGAAAGGDVLAAVMFAATAQDVRSVVIGGRDVVADGRHLLVDDVPGKLAAAIRAVTD